MNKRILFFATLIAVFCAWGDVLTGNSRAVEIVVNVGGTGPRPYVAVWIENPQGRVVRTLRVWGSKPKYQRELRAWKRAGGESVDGVSGATRPNGAYKVTWDGLGTDGQPLLPGEYVLRAECVREEGERSELSLKVPEGEGPVKVRAEGNGDLESIELTRPDLSRP